MVLLSVEEEGGNDDVMTRKHEFARHAMCLSVVVEMVVVHVQEEVNGVVAGSADGVVGQGDDRVRRLLQLLQCCPCEIHGRGGCWMDVVRRRKMKRRVCVVVGDDGEDEDGNEDDVAVGGVSRLVLVRVRVQILVRVHVQVFVQGRDLLLLLLLLRRRGGLAQPIVFSCLRPSAFARAIRSMAGSRWRFPRSCTAAAPPRTNRDPTLAAPSIASTGPIPAVRSGTHMSSREACVPRKSPSGEADRWWLA